MQETWKTLLDQTSPVPESLEPLRFDAPSREALAAAQGTVAAPLPRLGVVHVSGDDAAAFLHGQLTQSIEDQAPGQVRLGAWCNPKGRVLALFHVLRTDGGFLLITDRSLLDGLLKRLRMFVLRSKVDLRDASDEHLPVGISGPAAATLLAEAAGTPPADPEETVQAGDLHVLRLRGPGDRFAVLAPAGQTTDLWRMLTGGATPVGEEAWRLLDVRAGIPHIGPATTEHFVPQMLNLEALGGLSYSKGCYPGQEVVARMHYLGRLKRRLYRVAIAAGEPPPEAATVRDGAGAETGEIVLAARDGEGVCEALAVLRTDAPEREGLNVEGIDVRLLELPYAVGEG